MRLGPRPVAAQIDRTPEAALERLLSAFMRAWIWTTSEYIAVDNIDAADRWIEKLFTAFEALGQTPRMVHRREALTRHSVLFWPVSACLAIYRAERSPIEIVAVRLRSPRYLRITAPST